MRDHECITFCRYEQFNMEFQRKKKNESSSYAVFYMANTEKHSRLHLSFRLSSKKKKHINRLNDKLYKWQILNNGDGRRKMSRSSSSSKSASSSNSMEKGRSCYFTVQANLNSWISDLYSLFFLLCLDSCVVQCENGRVQNATNGKKGDGIQKFTYRCDMGARTHIVPQLFIVMTSTISNYSSIYSVILLLLPFKKKFKYFSGAKSDLHVWYILFNQNSVLYFISILVPSIPFWSVRRVIIIIVSSQYDEMPLV